MSAARCSLAAVCLAVLCATAHGGAFYFSASGTDANAGTSAAAPWRHLNMSMTVHTPSSFFLERGSLWTDETLQVWGATGVVGAYGNASQPRPTIMVGLGTHSDRITCLTLISPSASLRVTSLHLAGCTVGAEALFTGNTSTGLEITDCFFRDIRQSLGAYQISGGSWGSAISLSGNGGTSEAHDVNIHNNVGVRMDTFFNTHLHVDGLTLDSNTVAQCGYNCYSLGGTNMRLSNSVFLRDTPTRDFLYGTTDVIVGTVVGNNSIENCDFMTRGEFEDGPDGCAIDFETSAIGFKIINNTVYKSWGGGLMVFGHETTSHDFHIEGNIFYKAGCVQPRNDQAGIAFMCPNHNKPSGVVNNNTFFTCPGVPAMFESFPGCSDNVTKINNAINPPGLEMVELPQITVLPPAPTSTLPVVQVPVVAETRTPNATIRYTTDGSRPSETSPVVPPKGVVLQFPGPNLVFNVRAFHPGFLPSITNGAVIERSRYRPRGESGIRIDSSFDGIDINATAMALRGWAVDYALSGGGVPPVQVMATIDFVPVVTAVANVYREDLVKAKVAPNPEHGFEIVLPPAATAKLRSGRHIVSAFVVDSVNSPDQPVRINGAPACVCDGQHCDC